MLALVPGAVADADRAGTVIARQVIKGLLGEFPLTADPVHDLQVGVGLGEVGEEVEEVVRLRVETQRVQAPEHERRITQPRVAVVVVTVSAGRLRQRRGRRRQQGPGGRVDQPLERQRGPLQVLAPRVVGEVAPADPPMPEVSGAGQPLMGLGEGHGRGAVSPRQRAEDLLPGLQPVPGDRPRALEPQVQVSSQPDPRLAAARPGLCLAVTVPGIAPLTALAAVVEGWLAFHDEVDRPVQAAHRAQQHPFGPVVNGLPPVRARPGRRVPPTGRPAARPGRQPSPPGWPRWSPAPWSRAGSAARPGR